jgi:uncharacterized protein YjiS (DUF1127 family)
MTAIHWQSPRGRVPQHNAVGALNDAATQFVATLREWRRRTRDRGRLAELNDRMLRDIGLTRADAEFLINKPFWRE